MKYLIVLITLLVTGCTAFHEQPLPPSEATEIRLQVQWVESEIDIPKTATNYENSTKGAAIWFTDRGGNRACTVYMIKPYGEADFKGLKTLGHEVLHCTDGSFHNPAPYRHQDTREMLQ